MTALRTILLILIGINALLAVSNSILLSKNHHLTIDLQFSIKEAGKIRERANSELPPHECGTTIQPGESCYVPVVPRYVPNPTDTHT